MEEHYYEGQPVEACRVCKATDIPHADVEEVSQFVCVRRHVVDEPARPGAHEDRQVTHGLRSDEARGREHEDAAVLDSSGRATKAVRR